MLTLFVRLLPPSIQLCHPEDTSASYRSLWAVSARGPWEGTNCGNDPESAERGASQTGRSRSPLPAVRPRPFTATPVNKASALKSLLPSWLIVIHPLVDHPTLLVLQSSVRVTKGVASIVIVSRLKGSVKGNVEQRRVISR